MSPDACSVGKAPPATPPLGMGSLRPMGFECWRCGGPGHFGHEFPLLAITGGGVAAAFGGASGSAGPGGACGPVFTPTMIGGRASATGSMSAEEPTARRGTARAATVECVVEVESSR